MSTITISDCFDSGNIQVIDAHDPSNIQLEIRKDGAADFHQWFHFRVDGPIGQHCTFHIINAGTSSYSGGWSDYHVCTSWDRQDWFRTPSRYSTGVFSFDIELSQNTVYFAYFAPYSYERHLDLLAWAQQDARVSSNTLGQTLDGHAMQLLRISDTHSPTQKVWLIARQHPGESMAEWFIEGFLEALLDIANPIANKLLRDTAFYVVPNMNPDGSARGHLRTNAAGIDLNRAWESPSLKTSPEVYLVRERMMEEGGTIFLDIHGDEELPYNFVAGCEGNPSYNDSQAQQEGVFKEALMAISPDFQDLYGYPKDQPGKANLALAANWLGEHFKTLSFTIEMPFKDNANQPDARYGWSPERSKQLGHDVLFPIAQTLEQ